MKIIVFAFLLTVIYAFKPDVLKKFHENHASCANELGTTDKKRVDVRKCVLQKESLLDEENAYILEKGFALLDDIFSDAAKKQQASEILHNCYDHVYEGQEVTMKRF